MNKQEARQRAKALVDQMTVEEMTTQLLFNSAPIERLGIPAYNWWNEGLHGVARAGLATVFPQAIGLAAAFDEELMHEVGSTIATEGRAKYNEWTKNGLRNIYQGLTFWSPNINIFRDPHWGRGQETYGEDPFLTATLGRDFVESLQEKDENGYYKAAGCAKHFAVHSGPESLRHEFDAVVSKQDLFETYLPAFECLVKAGVLGVMPCYNRVLGMPAAGSTYLLQDILHDKWGFEGYVTSDCWAINDFHLHHHVTDTVAESAAMALNAGTHLNCGNAYLHLMTAYNDGLITKEKLAESVTVLLSIRFELGLFDKTSWDEIPYSVVDCEAHQALNERAAEESIVLLKNDGILPVDPSKVKTIAVIGPNSDSQMSLEGNYNGRASEYVTILEGVREAFPDAHVYSVEGSPYVTQNARGDFQEFRVVEGKIVAEKVDLVIAAVGLNCLLEGEEGDQSNAFSGGDKNSLYLPEPQMKLLETLCGLGKPLIVVSLVGSSIDLGVANEKANAIVHAWYPGAFGGRAFGRLITGKANFSGKLPVTFYKETNNIPAFTDYAMDNRTYKFFKEDPLYPFGYGLSYTKFAYSDFAAEKAEIAAGETVKVCAKVKNVGAVDGEEVVEVYIRDLEASTRVPRHKLCAFGRVKLAAGEEKTVCFELGAAAFQLIDENGDKVIEPGAFEIFIGGGQPDALTEKLTGTACVHGKVCVK